MRLKTSAIVLVLLCSVPKSFCGDIDDDILWEQLTQGHRDKSHDPIFPEIEDSDNLDLLETDLNSASENASVLDELPEIEASNNESSTFISDNISDELKSTFTWEQLDPLSERISRQPNLENTPHPWISPRHADRGIKGATSKPKPGQTSLVIIFDGTGSMLDDLKQLQKGAKDIVEEITKRDYNPIYNYIFIPFRDPDYGPVVNTIDQSELLAALENVDLIGGGDCPESSISGINAGLDIALPKSFVYIFTDATAQDYKFADETIKMIQEKQITLTFLLTGFCNSKNSPGYYVYETLAAISNGQVYNLQKTDVKDVLESIKQFLDANLVPISYVYSENPGPQNIELDVSKNLKEFTVSLAGDKPNITVIDPDKEEYTQQKDILDLDNLKIVNVQDPKPGKWNVHTQSESEHSVKLTAVSDVVFKFGFSTTQPNSIAETVVNPTKNVNNILAVSTSNNSLLHNLTSVEIVLFNAKDDPDEKRQLQIKLPLKRHDSVECDDESCLYLTKSFPPPLSLFKIYVNGFDSDGNPLKYLLSTAIQAINGEIPRVFIEESFVEVTEGDRVEILCKVISKTPAAVHWKVIDELRDAIATDDEKVWKYEIDAAKMLDAGKYTCNARNVHGMDKGQVTLIVKEKIIPLQIKMVDSNMISTENDTDYQISCFIRPRQKAVIEWYFNGQKINAENYLDWMTQNDNLVITRVNRKHTGEYTCVASNNRETKNATGHLNIFYEPEITNQDREDLTIPFDEPVTLPCNATGSPTPTMVWHRENLSEIVDSRIERFTPNDQGLYLCEASNGIGKTAWKEINLKGSASGPPKIIPMPYDTIEKKLGDDLLLKCECSQCGPVYYYKWTRGETADIKEGQGHAIGGIGPIRDEHTQSFQYDLELKNLNASDDGYYICEIGNAHGIDKIATRVTILEKPTIDSLISSSLIKDGMIKVSRGVDIQIECKAKGSPIPEIHWLINDAGIEPAAHIYTSKERLILRNLSEADMGEYKCVASNSLGTASEQVLLYVVVAPIFQPQKDTIITAHDGQTVEIECDVFAMPFPDIKWSFNNNDLNLTDEKYQLIGGQLSFVAEYKDNGVYLCEASNEAGEAKQEVALIVYVAPKLYPEEDDSASARINKNVTLKCRAEGFPIPDLLWTFDGEELTNSSRAYILDGGDLFLVEVTPNMAGPYICEASNKVGEKQRTTFLTVTEPPKVLSHFDPNINVTTDTSFSLMCAAQGTPKPDVFWAKDGEKYTDGPQQQYLDVSYGKISSGNYTCVAQSPEGADTKTVTISAIELPRLVDIQSILKTKINVTEGDNLEINCPYMYAKKITWYKDDFKFHAEQPNPASTSLQLPAATLSDRGNYTCIAENEAGSRNFTQEVKVLAPPRVITNDVIERFGDTQIPIVTVRSGEDLEMNCPMEGFPQPKVKWMKDNTLISTEPDLVLKNVQPFHDGRYDCEARNIYGSADYSYILKVLAEPTTHLPKHTRKEIHEGGNLELECSFIGNPPPIITWQRNNITLAETDVPLVLMNVQPKERGVYKCVGTNSVGSAEIVYTVDVLETPKFTFVNDDVKISESDDLMLRCATRGNPLPIVVWTYNGQMIIGSSKIPRTVEKSYGLLELDESGNPISNGHSNDIALNNGLVSTNTNGNVKKDHFYGKVYYDQDSVSLMLIIKSLDRKLPGTYTCHAVNAMGSVEKDVKVDVLVSPLLQGRDVDTQPTVNLTLLGGLPVILFCPWHGVPTPSIEWLKNNAHLKTDYRTQISHDGHVVTILVSDTSDSGTYHCRARNEAGFDQREFNVNILAPPHFRLGNLIGNRISDEPERLLADSAQHVVPGEKIIFNCPVTGNPPPTVFWLETTLGTVNETRILPETSTQLVLENVEKSATYTCYANNSLGFTEKRYEVLILKTPEIRDFQPQQTVNEHHTISLNCPVVGGSPTPEITWLKNGESLLENSKNVFLSQDKTTLKVLNAKKYDSAVYTCRATNLAGQQERDINVTVITPVVWSEWDPWTPCSHSCGIGVSTRKRRCIRLDGESAQPSDPVCVGRSHESKTCEVSLCPIDGGWGPWSNWTSCSKHCWNPKDNSKPTMKRYRECDSPKPALGGRACPGIDYEEVECNTQPCIIDGGWSAWTKWSPCSVSCGSGFATRYRECNNPVPLHGGQICLGSALESQICYAGPCPIHGGWTEWSSWSECSQTCGSGFRKRKRTCTSPEPYYGGLHCLGDNVEVVKCRLRKCENSELLRSLNEEKKKTLKPAAQFESKAEYNLKDSIEYTSPKGDDESYNYATGSSSYSTPMDGNTRTTRYPGEEQGTHVVVKVEKLTPIDKDTTQINFFPGLAPIVVRKMLPCNQGFTMNENGTCTDVNECQQSNPCKENQICTNTIGSFTCSCLTGYKLNEYNICEDINECLNPFSNPCSYECRNTPGGFVCSCPSGQILSLDLRSCIRLATTTNDYAMSDPAARSFEFEEGCPNGYYENDGECRDIDECENAEDDCSMDQTCLNTNGSYLCIPTSCPEEYKRDEISRQCVQMCNVTHPCFEGAQISQTLSYTLLTLDSIMQSEPFLKLVNYDINRIPLAETKFFLDHDTNPTLFRLSTIPMRKGIAYLYGSNKIKKEKLYNVKVKAYSYDANHSNLLYVTKFVIYLYVM